MSDNKQNTDYRDRTEVNQNESYEVQYWTQKWGITKEQLSEAITGANSTSVTKIEEYLRLRDMLKSDNPGDET
jgi:hypothetical protein